MFFNKNKDLKEDLEQLKGDFNSFKKDAEREINGFHIADDSFTEYRTGMGKIVRELENKTSKLAVIIEGIDKRLTTIETNLSTYAKLENICRKQTKEIKLLHKKYDNLINQVETEISTPQQYWLNNVSKSYRKPLNMKTIEFDGWNFKYCKTKAKGEILINIIDVIDIYNNLEDILININTNGKNNNYYQKKYGLKNHMIWNLVLYTLLTTDFYEKYAEPICREHLYEENGGLIYVDGKNTGIAISHLNEIKTLINNSNNKKETIDLFTHRFNYFDLKTFIVLCLNINKLPSRWLKTEPAIRTENDTKGRF